MTDRTRRVKVVPKAAVDFVRQLEIFNNTSILLIPIVEKEVLRTPRSMANQNICSFTSKYAKLHMVVCLVNFCGKKLPQGTKQYPGTWLEFQNCGCRFSDKLQKLLIKGFLYENQGYKMNLSLNLWMQLHPLHLRYLSPWCWTHFSNDVPAKCKVNRYHAVDNL